MFSAEVKVVLGFEPSGLLEKIIFAPWIGTPRTVADFAVDDEFEDGLDVLSGLFGVEGASFLGIVGIFIFGMLNCPDAVSVKNDAMTIAATNVKDNLGMKISS